LKFLEKSAIFWLVSLRNAQKGQGTKEHWAGGHRRGHRRKESKWEKAPKSAKAQRESLASVAREGTEAPEPLATLSGFQEKNSIKQESQM
jgi:hypothetical protein